MLTQTPLSVHNINYFQKGISAQIYLNNIYVEDFLYSCQLFKLFKMTLQMQSVTSILQNNLHTFLSFIPGLLWLSVNFRISIWFFRSVISLFEAETSNLYCASHLWLTSRIYKEKIPNCNEITKTGTLQSTLLSVTLFMCMQMILILYVPNVVYIFVN